MNLYERQEQVDKLQEAFRRSLETSFRAGEVVLISGVSGTGKTVLARSLRDCASYWMEGKFDQQQSPEPFGPFRSALSKLAKNIQNEEKNERERIKNVFCKGTGESAASETLLHMVPEFGEVLGVEERTRMPAQFGDRSSQKLFFELITKFFAVLATPSRPVIIFLDDLQWADSGSIRLTKALVAKHSPGLLVLVAFRSNQESSQALPDAVRLLTKPGTFKLTTIDVSPLTENGVKSLISDDLKRPGQECRDLAEIIYQHTGGNVLFVKQLLRMMQYNSILHQDSLSGEWIWDPEMTSQVLSRAVDVVRMLARRMRSLPSETQQVLKVCSCMGNRFDEQTVFEVGPVVSSQVAEAISIAEDLGFVSYDYESGVGEWIHDRIQEAAYELIDVPERPAFHLQFARSMMRKVSSTSYGSEKALFLVVKQLRYCSSLCNDVEKEDFASLCLRAGKIAASSAAFSVALMCFEQGIALLAKRHWRDQYQLSLQLYNSAAESSYCSGSFCTVDELLEQVFANARCLEDSLWAHNTHIYSLGARSREDEAIDIGLSLLKKLGVALPRRPNVMHICWEFMKTERLLRKKSDDDILNLPKMTDKTVLAVMQIMNLISIYTLYSRQELLPVVSMRMLQVMLLHGCHGMGSAVIGCYASILTFVGKIDDAYRFAQLAIRIRDKLRLREWVARTNCVVYSSVMPWFEPLRNSLDPLLQAHRMGLDTGDIEFAMLGASTYCQFCIYSAHLPLDHLLREMTCYYEQGQLLGQETTNEYLLPMMQFCLNLMGKGAADPLTLTGEAMDENQLLRDVKAHKNHGGKLWILGLKYLLAVYLLEYDAAERLLRLLKKEKQVLLPPLKVQHFHEAVMHAVLARDKSSSLRARQRNFCLAKKRLKLVRGYATHSASNFANKVALVEAELAVSRRQHDKALSWFRRSIQNAEEEGFVHEHALACERAGFFLLKERKRITDAIVFLKKARVLYSEYGARIKVERIDRILPDKESGFCF